MSQVFTILAPIIKGRGFESKTITKVTHAIIPTLILLEKKCWSGGFKKTKLNEQKI
jgi:hypothetical protein